MLVQMRRIEIVMPRSQADAVLRSLHRAGSVHLVPFEPRSALAASVFSSAPPGSTMRLAEDLLGEVTALAGALTAARPQVAMVRELWPLDLEGLRGRVDALLPVRSRANELLAQHARLKSESSRLAGYRRIIEALRPVVGRFPSLPGFGSTAIIVHARYRGVLGLVRSELEAITDSRCEMVASEISGDRVAALLVYPLGQADKVRLLLGGRDLEELTLPEELSGLPFPQLVERLADREREADGERRAVDRELDRLVDAHGAPVAALQLILQDRVAEERTLAAAGMSDHLVLLSGWIPAARLERLRERLADEVGPAVCLDEVATDRRERVEAPVAIQNPPLFQAFAPLASFVSLPRYGTIDPTPTLAASFPIFVGLMVGDVAYGVALLGLLLLARWRWPSSAWIRSLTPVVALAGLSTVVFGILFGEWLGNAGQQFLGIRPVLFDRTEAVSTFLLIAIAIGAGQIAIGLLLGIANSALQQHGHELAARIGLLALLVATLVLLGWLVGMVPPTAAHLAIAVLAVALAVLIASLGMAGPIEAIGMLGNVLSYARLMAIGMASVMLALVANRLAGLGGNLVVGLLIATLLHAVNVVLGFFDATVQGLRLHYIEFFTKFVEPGGAPYQPFACVLDRIGAESAPLPMALQGGT
ncbi:MAG: V-type ATP synthase subunit I [Candidatus Limnocylindria bacterium]